jgi:hypothetical protein
MTLTATFIVFLVFFNFKVAFAHDKSLKFTLNDMRLTYDCPPVNYINPGFRY